MKQFSEHRSFLRKMKNVFDEEEAKIGGTDTLSANVSLSREFGSRSSRCVAGNDLKLKAAEQPSSL